MRSLRPLVVVPRVVSSLAAAQPATVSDDKAWSTSPVALRDTMEAQFIVRVGDVDNLGFGWPEGFDPFCGRMTQGSENPEVVVSRNTSSRGPGGRTTHRNQ